MTIAVGVDKTQCCWIHYQLYWGIYNHYMAVCQNLVPLLFTSK